MISLRWAVERNQCFHCQRRSGQKYSENWKDLKDLKPIEKIINMLKGKMLGKTTNVQAKIIHPR
jgi:hypothetical protein